MCEECHREFCCVHGRRPLRFWGLGGASYPRCASGPWVHPGYESVPGHWTGPAGMPSRELLEEQKAALSQRLKWLDAQLQELGR